MRTVHFKPDLCAVTNSRDPIELKNSIVLVEGNSEYLIGDDAKDYGGSGQRLIGGSIQDKHYQRYIQALLAKGLGPGDHTISIGLSAAANYIDEFRTDKSSNVLNQEDHKLLAGLVAEIRFRSGRTDAPIQLCRVKLKPEDVPVLYETEAVRNVIPNTAMTFGIFQIGGGDWQSLLVVDGEIKRDTHARVAGIRHCISRMKEQFGLQPDTAEKAWHTETAPRWGKHLYASEWESCVDATKEIVHSSVATYSPELVNKFQGYQDRIKAIVLSGGAVHDATFVDALIAEMPSRYSIYTIDQFQIMEPDGSKLMDPSFTCAFGIHSTGVNVGLDIGNAYLKGVFDV